MTVENFQELFAGILNSKDLEGLRLLVTQFPQQQFNATADRKTEQAAGHAGRFLLRLPRQRPHLGRDAPGRRHPAAKSHRRRLDTTSLRGVNIQRLFGSQRALKSVEDFTEFEQRAAYFDGDQVSAAAKGINPLERGSQVHFMAEFQELLDFPPAPGLGIDGKLDPKKFGDDYARDAGARPLLRQGEVRELPPGAVLHRQLDAQPEGRAILQDADDQRPGGDRRKGRSRRSRSAASRSRPPISTTADC